MSEEIYRVLGVFLLPPEKLKNRQHFPSFLGEDRHLTPSIIEQNSPSEDQITSDGTKTKFKQAPPNLYIDINAQLICQNSRGTFMIDSTNPYRYSIDIFREEDDDRRRI